MQEQVLGSKQFYVSQGPGNITRNTCLQSTGVIPDQDDISMRADIMEADETPQGN